jgi:hypothetical protein
MSAPDLTPAPHHEGLTDEQLWEEWAAKVEAMTYCPRCKARYADDSTFCYPPDATRTLVGWADIYCHAVGLNVDATGRVVDK